MAMYCNGDVLRLYCEVAVVCCDGYIGRSSQREDDPKNECTNECTIFLDGDDFGCLLMMGENGRVVSK